MGVPAAIPLWKELRRLLSEPAAKHFKLMWLTTSRALLERTAEFIEGRWKKETSSQTEEIGNFCNFVRPFKINCAFWGPDFFQKEEVSETKTMKKHTNLL